MKRLVIFAVIIFILQGCTTTGSSDSEYLVVHFSEDRPVILDGEEVGRTEHLLEVAPGSYEVSLGGPQDYQPQSRSIVLNNTSTLRPQEVIFEKNR